MHLVPLDRDRGEALVHTVLMDGDDVPAAYRECYLARLSTTVALKRCAAHEAPVVRATGEGGEERVVGDRVRDLVEQAWERTVALLGPQVQARIRNRRAEIIVRLRCPAPVTEVTGRSLLLPLVVSLAQAAGEFLNLSAVVRPDPSVVWTGDVDAHGAILPVACMGDKASRVGRS